MKQPILLVGAGGHARACIDVIEQENRFRIVGLVGMAHEVGEKILGYSVLGTDKQLSVLHSQSSNALITVGQIKTPNHRIRLMKTLKHIGFELVSVISPNAYVSPHSSIGEGTIVMHGAFVNAGTDIGRNCILNTNSLIEHDVLIGDHCHISTDAVLNGGVNVGACSFIGSNACVREMIRIGSGCLIGMGEKVFKDIPDDSQFLTLERTLCRH